MLNLVSYWNTFVGNPHDPSFCSLTGSNINNLKCDPSWRYTGNRLEFPILVEFIPLLKYLPKKEISRSIRAYLMRLGGR